MRGLVQSLAMVAATCCCGIAGAREWTDASGKFSVEADFKGVIDGVVMLETKEGGALQVPLEKLSKADQDFIQRLRENRRPAPKRPPRDKGARGAKQAAATLDRVCGKLREAISTAYLLHKDGKPVGAKTVIGVGEVQALSVAEREELVNRARRGEIVPDLIGRLPFELRDTTLNDIVYRACGEAIYPFLNRLAKTPRPLDDELQNHLAAELARTSAFLDEVFADDEEQAIAIYHALDPFWRPVVVDLNPNAAVAWPGPKLAAAIVRPAWPPPETADFAQLAERARSEVGKPARFIAMDKIVNNGERNQLRFSRDGRTVSARQQRLINGPTQTSTDLFNVASGERIALLNPGQRSFESSFSPDGRHILVGCENGIATVYETNTGAKIRECESAARYVAWSPSGVAMAVSKGEFTTSRDRGEVVQWIGLPQRKVEPIYSTGLDEFTPIEYSPDGYTLLTGPALKNWRGPRDASTIEIPPPPQDSKPSSLYHCAFSADGGTFAGLLRYEKQYRVCIWDWATLKLRKSWDVERLKDGTAYFSLSPDGRYVLLGHGNGPLQLWSIDKQLVIRRFPDPNGLSDEAPFHPSGMYVAVRYGPGVVLWPTGLAPVRDASGRVVLSDAVNAVGRTPKRPFPRDKKTRRRIVEQLSKAKFQLPY